ncbi:hypothetical protein BGZ70_008890 [Mortierella alpina]|uniref:Glycosyltransferase family 32 protein n=1 Tax=Mortierella alpina TaxID=64518 RepID=A0A9P6J2W0_MORAP|nr:hypothetical protein BGZ70_008890 [Mortierella alpina]
MVLQYRSVAILAAVSAFATLFYLSLWSRLGQTDQDADGPSSSVWPNVLHSKEHPTDQPPQHQQKHTAPQPEQQPQPQQQQQLVSENNARVAALNTEAFASFCNSKPSGVKPEFASYREWIDYINNKNSKWVRQKQQHPLFLERPLANWVVNLTAMNEQCNRLVHTSAHCLHYLTREHEYLIPSKVSEAQAAAAAPPATDPMNFHIFWRGPITDKLSLSAHSFLFTQPLKRAHLHLWIDSADLPDGLPEDYTQNAFAAPLVKEPLNRFITIHVWDQAAEHAYSYGEDEDDSTHALEQQLMSLSTPGEQDKPVKPVALSDEARFLILNRNGGIYLDADVLLLKDMSPFHDSGIEFAYEWSHTRMYNTAILRLYPRSSVARRILDGAKNREMEILRKKLLQMQAASKTSEDAATEKHQALAAAQGQERRKKKKVDIVRQPKIRTKKTLLNRRSSAAHPERAPLSKRGEMRPEEIYHPARLRTYLRPQDSKIEGNGLEMMPPAFFDPLWLRVDHAETKETQDTDLLVEDLHSFPDAFTKVDAVCPGQEDDEVDFSAGPEVFLAGAYAYHWHNNWETAIEPKSWMGLMKQAYDDFVNARRPNLYGEWFEEQL